MESVWVGVGVRLYGKEKQRNMEKGRSGGARQHPTIFHKMHRAIRPHGSGSRDSLMNNGFLETNSKLVMRIRSSVKDYHR